VFLLAACVVFPFRLLFEHTEHTLSLNLVHISLTAKLFHDFGCLGAPNGVAEITIS
jgi:hypothetical protein